MVVIFFSVHFLGGISWDSFPGHFFAQEKSWDANSPSRCPRIGWYFCTYDDTYFISSYVKVCVRYSMIVYIRLSTLGDCPGMSWESLVP